MKNVFESIGGRKFILTIAIMVIFTIFVIMDKMTVDQFIPSILTGLGIFSGSNVANKFVPKKDNSVE